MKPQKLADNKYKYVKRYYHPKLGKHKRVSVTLDRDTPQARNRAEVILQSRIDEILNQTNENGLTFSEVSNKWIAFKKNKIAKNTYISYNNIIKNHLTSSSLWNYLLDEITTHDVQTYLDTKFEEGFKRSTVEVIRHVTTAIIEYGKNHLDVETRVVRSNIALPMKQARKNRKYFTNEEIERIREFLSKPRYKIYLDFFNLLLWTGMRAGEAVVLTDEDFKNGKIHVNKTYSYYYEGKVQPFPKRASSDRIISSSTKIDSLIKGRIRINKMVFKDTNLIFTKDGHSPLRYSYFTQLLGRVDSRFGSHWCRHTHISMLAEKKWTLKQIMERVGQSDPSVTLSIYTEVTESLSKMEYDDLDELI